ncbi:MAG: dihydroneopterin aldolase [Candidatus Margulisiibacteriota bacterium]|nr:MAG: dihydroneopterin aldolase [Candidatus Margulisbacteria bacterium GWD2_39_127]OGI02857.1 MAG: dihydroneopterin aldolase [Candidatus Margulisbacteria bacterium GWF2_38_17]OGI09638.1 MAG: dihydroneopterin aldolase [Candidatus Margulisbacteria bacterium GWE2_39_32]PZM83036.1 MAG: dihydroneopterin aldolase [Candidatus Margulisiibacteriota bacterium]HAR62197.1 dihydroneopterin aldolase [Candidatus Margulisiibacteriota bacterium]
MDKILINDLRTRCIIGVNDKERREKQDVVINIKLSLDLQKAGKSDRFEDTLDYRTLKKAILNNIENSSCYLIEALAESIAGICLANPIVAEVNVLVEKPMALRFARSAGVEIVRKQKAEQ